jgi:hypothetical protein
MRNSLAYLGFFSIVAMSCTTTAPPDVDTPYGTFIGRMTGRVIPFDGYYTMVSGLEAEVRDTLTSLYAGTTVSLQSTAFTTTTDAKGQWTLDSVPAGTYTILFAKQGFHAGNGLAQFGGAGIYFAGDYYVFKIPTETGVLESLTLIDSIIRDTGYLFLRYTGHTPHKNESFAVWTSVSPDTNFVFAGSRTGDSNAAFSVQVVGMAEGNLVGGYGKWLTSGQIVRFRITLSAVGLTRTSLGWGDQLSLADGPYSNTLSVTIP